jgi:hypothetical protein
MLLLVDNACTLEHGDVCMKDFVKAVRDRSSRTVCNSSSSSFSNDYTTNTAAINMTTHILNLMSSITELDSTKCVDRANASQ